MEQKKHKHFRTTNSSSKGGGREGAIYYSVLVVLMLIFGIYTATKFPYTYITMEGDNFWVLTWDFWKLKLATLPAITMWLNDYLMQYYASVPVAACIQTLTLGIIGVLAHTVLKRLSVRKWLYWLGLLPSVILGFYCTFCLSFQLQWIFLLLLVLVFLSIRNFKGQVLFSLLCVPVGFLLMTTPMLAVLLLILFLSPQYRPNGEKVWKPSLGKVGMGLLSLLFLGITPKIYSQQVAFIPFEERYNKWGTYFDPLTSVYSHDGEYIKKCVCMANDNRWEDLLYKEHIKSDAQRGNGTALRYALLAESALGTLPENLLDYPINDENLFLYPHLSNRVASPFNRLFYLNLGVYDEAFHHAQEYSLLMANGNSFSSIRQLTDYSIEEGEWDIAEKFLTVLSRSSCHKDFIKDRRAMMEKAKKSFNKNIALRADNFVGGYPFPVEMLRLARYYKDSPNRKKMVDYAICAYIIRGDYNSFMIAVNSFDIYKDKELPKAYRIFAQNFK